MKQYKVTLNFTFEKEYCDVDDFAEEEYDEENEDDMEEKKKRDAFARTDKYFETNNIETYIKENDALGFVETVLCDGDLVSAEWDPVKFAIHMVVNTDQTKEELKYELQMNSLEDGEYEACGDTGWIVMTRKEKNDPNRYWDSTNDFVYGLTDYRRNPIVIKEINKTIVVPKEDALFSLSDKGKEMYQKMASLKLEGVQFSEDDELKFKVMKILMKDTRFYPIGKA